MAAPPKKSPANEAALLFEKGEFKRAAKLFRRVLATEPDNTSALFGLALSLYEARQFALALKYWNRLKRVDPRQGNLYLNIGCVFQKLGRNDRAIRNYKAELRQNPASGEALYNLGTLYYNAKKYALAVGFLERCHALGHSVGSIIDCLAHCYFKTGQIEKEIALYEDFLASHPCDTWCLNNLGAALMQLGEHNRAQLYLQKAAKIDPRDAMVLRNIERNQNIRREMRAEMKSHP